HNGSLKRERFIIMPQTRLFIHAFLRATPSLLSDVVTHFGIFCRQAGLPVATGVAAVRFRLLSFPLTKIIMV
ncbi:hypothetical protein ACXO29_004190, partial [Cronobacter sakazakii]